MNSDRSRERSLFFLLSTIARNLETPDELKAKFKESIGSLQIGDAGESWRISLRNIDESFGEIIVPKNKFLFYPVKSADRYEVNPVVQNRNSAEEVLLYFYGKFNIRVIGKKNTSEPIYAISSNLISLILISFTAISVQSQIVLLAVVSLSLYVLYAISKLKLRLRSSLISTIAIFAPFIVYISTKSSASIAWYELACIILIQIINEVLINIRLNKYAQRVVAVCYAFILATVLLLPFDNIGAQGLAFAIFLSWLGHSITTPQKARDVLSPFTLCIFVALIIILLLLSPGKILLMPLVVLIAIQNAVVGSSRNPARLGFGALCLL